LLSARGVQCMQSYELEALGLSLWGCEHDRVAANTAAQVGQCGMIRGKSDPSFRYPQRVLLNSQLVTSNGRRHLNVSRHCFLFQTSTVAQEMLSCIPQSLIHQCKMGGGEITREMEEAHKGGLGGWCATGHGPRLPRIQSAGHPHSAGFASLTSRSGLIPIW
jgi:hypothetical protein